MLPSLFRRALRARPYASAAAFLAASLGAFLQVALPALSGQAIDIATGASHAALSPVIWGMIGAALGNYAMSATRRVTAGVMTTNAQAWLRVELLRTMHRLDGPGQDSLVAGQVISRTTADLSKFQMVLASAPMFLNRVLLLAATLVAMLWMSPLLAGLSLLLLPVILWEANRSRHTLYAATWANQQATADVSEHIEQTITGVRVVKAFGQEHRAIERLEALSRELYAVKMRAARIMARFQPLLAQLPKFALVITLIVGGLLAIGGTLSIGEFVAFTAYLSSMTATLSTLTSQYVRLQMGFSSFDRLEQLLDLAPQSEAAPYRTSGGVLPSPGRPLGLNVEALSFKSALDDVSFNVEPGETVAIVGPPGAGKTIAGLIIGGFYSPDAGQLSFFDATSRTSYSSLSPAEIQQYVTCVFDEAELFSTSIFENIALGATHQVSAQDVYRAARLACADEFIRQLPAGYDTVVGERGLTLSGGQRQRIALARALLQPPAVLVLDDATSAIDAATEAAILQHLQQKLPNTTVLAIAHRHSTVEHADRVLLLERGRIIVNAERSAAVTHPAYRALMQPNTSSTRKIDAGLTQPSRAVLWPHTPNDAPRRAVASPGQRGAILSSPELLERVAALPEAQEEPTLPTDFVRALYAAETNLRLARLFRAVRWLILGTIALLLVGLLCDLAFPTLVRAAVDRGITAKHASTLLGVGGIAAVVVLVGWGVNWWMTLLSQRCGERLLYALRLRCYVHVQHLGMSFFESRLTGKIMTRLTTDIDTLSSFLQTGLAQTVVAIGSIVGVSVMLLVTSPSLALLAFTTVPLIAVATLVFQRYVKRTYRATRTQLSTVNGSFAELLGAIHITQTQQAGANVEQRFAQQVQRYSKLRLRSTYLGAAYFPGMQALTQVMTALILGAGAQRVADGTLSVGVLVAFTMYLGQLYGPLQQLGQLFDLWQRASVSFERLRELLRMQTTVPDHGTRHGASGAAAGAIEFRNVSFAYGEDTPLAVQEMNLSLTPGRTVALVGATGSGKSTIVKLLARLYDPTAGAITASNTPITEFPLTHWRNAVAQVPQESYLFPGTIAENIAYGRPNATKQQVEAAVRRIGALDIIAAIPGGFHAQIRERGRGLSAGQRQIIALARAELVEPAVVLLDEATATLDPATELAVLEATEQATTGRTAVMVAHRLATAARADRILVIDEGRIIEDGSHETLLSLNGRYAHLWSINHQRG